MKRINERKEKRQIAEKSNIITEEKENRKQTKNKKRLTFQKGHFFLFEKSSNRGLSSERI